MKDIPTWVWWKLGFNPNDMWDWINMSSIPDSVIEKVIEEGP